MSTRLRSPKLVTKHGTKRGKISSSDYNDIQDEIFTDLSILYENIYNVQTNIEDIEVSKNVEQLSIQYKLDKITQELESLKRLNSSELQKGNKFYEVINANDIQNIYEPELDNNEGIAPELYYDLEHNQVTLDISNVTEYSNFGANIEIAEDLIDEPSSATVTDNDITLAIDSSDSRAYHRTVSLTSTFDNTQSVSCGFILTTENNESVPINTLLLHLYPHNSLTIDSIEYYDGENWSTVFDYQSSLPIYNADRELFYFPRIKTNKIRVKITQPIYYMDDNVKKFTYGVKEMNVMNTIFESEGYALWKLEFPNNLNNISIDSNDIELFGQSEHEITKLIVTVNKDEPYKIPNTGGVIELPSSESSSINLTVKDVYVLLKFLKPNIVGYDSDVIKGIYIPYTVVKTIQGEI